MRDLIPEEPLPVPSLDPEYAELLKNSTLTEPEKIRLVEDVRGIVTDVTRHYFKQHGYSLPEWE